MVSQVVDIDTDSSGTMDLDITMAAGGSTGRSNQHGSKRQEGLRTLTWFQGSAETTGYCMALGFLSHVLENLEF